MSTKKTKEKSNIQTETYEELVDQDPDFYRGSAAFQFPNGDKYEGEFCAHTSGLIWRQGTGTYKTTDGQIYSGYWDGDKIDEAKEIEITYPNGTKYIGYLSKNKYSGPGIYQLGNQVSLLCQFAENKPVGDITLIDSNNKMWHGYADENDSLLLPEHIHFQSINTQSGKGKLRATPKQPSFQIDEESDRSNLLEDTKLRPVDTMSNESLKYSDLRNMEAQIFAKSKKTASDFKLEESEWYQDYINFQNTFAAVIAKVENEGIDSLTQEEQELFREYNHFEESYKKILNDFKNKTPKLKENDDLFQLIHSEKYKNQLRSVPVFYLNQEIEEQN